MFICTRWKLLLPERIINGAICPQPTTIAPVTGGRQTVLDMIAEF